MKLKPFEPIGAEGDWTRSLGLVTCVALAFTLGGVYEHLVDFGVPVPLYLGSIGLGWLIGWSVAHILQSTGCRKRALARKVVIGSAIACSLGQLLASYLDAVVDLATKHGVPAWKLLNVLTLFEYLRERVGAGRAVQVHGYVTQLGASESLGLWIGCCALSCIPALAALDRFSRYDAPFCPRCNRVSERCFVGYKTHVSDADWERAVDGTLDDVVNVRSKPAGDGDNLLYFIERCPRCCTSLTLEVIWREAGPDRYGMFSGDSETVLPAVEVTDEHVEQLKRSIRVCENIVRDGPGVRRE